MLQVINASPGDLTPVFDAMLEKAHAPMRRGASALVSIDGAYLGAVAAHGFSRTSRPAPFRGSAFPRLVRRAMDRR